MLLEWIQRGLQYAGLIGSSIIDKGRESSVQAYHKPSSACRIGVLFNERSGQMSGVKSQQRRKQEG